MSVWLVGPTAAKRVRLITRESSTEYFGWPWPICVSFQIQNVEHTFNERWILDAVLGNVYSYEIRYIQFQLYRTLRSDVFSRVAYQINSIHNQLVCSFNVESNISPTRTRCRHTDAIISWVPKTMIPIVVWIRIGTGSVSSLDAGITRDRTGTPFRPHTPTTGNFK